MLFFYIFILSLPEVSEPSYVSPSSSGSAVSGGPNVQGRGRQWGGQEDGWHGDGWHWVLEKLQPSFPAPAGPAPLCGDGILWPETGGNFQSNSSPLGFFPGKGES